MSPATDPEPNNVPTRKRRVLKQLKKILPSDHICIQQHFPRFYAKCKSLRLVRDHKTDAVAEDPDVLKEAIVKEQNQRKLQDKTDQLTSQCPSFTDKKKHEGPVRKVNLVVQSTFVQKRNNSEQEAAHGSSLQLPSSASATIHNLKANGLLRSNEGEVQLPAKQPRESAVANLESAVLASPAVPELSITIGGIKLKRPSRLLLVQSQSDLKPRHSTDFKSPTETPVSRAVPKFSVISASSPLIQRSLIHPGNPRRSSCGPSFLVRSNLGQWRSSVRPKTAKSSPPTPTAPEDGVDMAVSISTATLDLSSHLESISLQRGCWLQATLTKRSRSPMKIVESNEPISNSSDESSPATTPRVIFLHRKRSPTESVSRLELAKEILAEFERQKCESVPNLTPECDSDSQNELSNFFSYL